MVQVFFMDRPSGGKVLDDVSEEVAAPYSWYKKSENCVFLDFMDHADIKSKPF
jgi:hypothetical protein